MQYRQLDSFTVQVPNMQRNNGEHTYNSNQDNKVSKISSEKQLLSTEAAQESPSERYSDKELTFKSKSAY